METWEELPEDFMQQFEFNLDFTLTRDDLSQTEKKENESFKEYAQRWHGLATQVSPALTERQMIKWFLRTLPQDFYSYMIGFTSDTFSKLVLVGERIEYLILEEKLSQIEKKENESFKEYAQRWHGLATQVFPALTEQQMIEQFLKTLPQDFYSYMIGFTSDTFSKLVLVCERVEYLILEEKLSQIEKKENESFKEYAQRWHGLATQVFPALTEQQMIEQFLKTLPQDFYSYMIGFSGDTFSKLVLVGERVEYLILEEKLSQIEKKENESFKEYAQRWHGLATQVCPALTEQQIIERFLKTLPRDFYSYMIGFSGDTFSKLVPVGERIENLIRDQKLSELS